MRGLLWMFLIAFCGSATAQVHFNRIPREFGLLPRNLKTNRGEARFSGTITGNYPKLSLWVTQNGKPYATVTKGLIYSSGTATFDVSQLLLAGKYHYDLTLLFMGADTLQFSIQDIVVGDAYIVQGQSNAVANSYGGYANATYGDSFIRSFGTSSYDPNSNLADTNWHLAEGDGYYSAGCIGQWALVMAKGMLDSTGIPVSIMNGAVGGTSVTYHQRYNPQPDHPATCYGRLLYRMRKAGLDKNVRSILWFQGESDGFQPKVHDSLFRVLYADWFKDYKGMEQNYLVQVRGLGCGNPGADLMEIQRQFEFELPKMKVISSNGLNGHNGCHYSFNNGYQQLGLALGALAMRDLHNSGRTMNIDPPNILYATWNNAGRTEIRLHLRKPTDSVFVDAGFDKLFYVSGDPNVKVTGAYLKNNTVRIQLNQGTCKPITLTYLGLPGSQPWVKNRMGMGLISFDGIPVEDQVQTSSYYGCPNEDKWLGEDSLAGCKYEWKSLKSGKKKTSARIVHHFIGDENYQLLVTYTTSGCLTDTFTIGTYTDNSPPPYAGRDSTLCHGDSIRLALDFPYASVLWTQNGSSHMGSDFTTADAGTVQIVAKSSQGCSYSDSLTIKTSNPTLDLGPDMQVCPNGMANIHAQSGFAAYLWSPTGSRDSAIVVGKGTYWAMVTDAAGCAATDTVKISEYAVAIPSPIFGALCPDGYFEMKIPPGFIRWELDTKILPSTYYTTADTFTVQCIDSQGCVAPLTAQISRKFVPYFSLGEDTGACSESGVWLQCSFPSQIYRWNGKASSDAKLKTTGPGVYTCAVTATSGCTYSDTVTIAEYPSPAFSLPADTSICNGDVWKPILPANYQYEVNGLPVAKVQFSIGGQYYLRAISDRGCATEKETFIRLVPCSNATQAMQKNNLSLYPNPAIDKLMVPQETGTVDIYTLNGRSLGRLVVKNHTCDISSLPVGAYWVHTQNGGAGFLKTN